MLHCRRSFKYRRLSLQDEADEGAENERLPLAASAQQQQQQAMPPSSSLAADLDFAEAAAAAEKASAAARASAVAHRESLIAAAQVKEPCNVGLWRKGCAKTAVGQQCCVQQNVVLAMLASWCSICSNT